MIVQQDECEKQTSSKVYAKEEVFVVNRFESESINEKNNTSLQLFMRGS